MPLFKSMVGAKLASLLDSLSPEEREKLMVAINDSSKLNSSKVIILDEKPVKVTSVEGYITSNYSTLIKEIVDNNLINDKYELAMD